MKLLFFCVFLLLSLSSHAQKKGIGVSFGNPTGLNGKYWLAGKRAIDASLAYSLGRNTNVNLHSDYLFHKADAFYWNDTYPLDLYYGLGGRMEFAGDIELGIRIPVGLTHFLEEQSADIFAEVAPVIEILTKSGLEMHLLFGARYYFN